MHASVSEICLSLQLSVKVKGCMILLLRRLVQKSRLKMWPVDTSEMVDIDMLCKTYLIEANQTYQCKKRLNAAWTPEFHPLPFPLHAGNHHGFLYWVGLDVYPLLNACDLPGVLDWVELDFHLLLHAGDHHVLCYELDFVFNLFCLQVTSMAFWRDLFFTLFCMQVTIMTFWIE